MDPSRITYHGHKLADLDRAQLVDVVLELMQQRLKLKRERDKLRTQVENASRVMAKMKDVEARFGNLGRQ